MLRFEKLPSPPMPKELELPQGISPRLARMLYARAPGRGRPWRHFLHPSAAQLYDPFLFRDMDKAVARLREAAEKGAADLRIRGLRCGRCVRHGHHAGDPGTAGGPGPFTMSPPGTGRAMA